MNTKKSNNFIGSAGGLVAVAMLGALISLLTCCNPSDKAPDPNADPVVIVYRSDTQRGPGFAVVLSPKPIVCDGKKLADLGNHRAFAVRLPTGEHSFKVEGRSDWFSTDLEVETGRIYYVVLYAGRLLKKGKNDWSMIALDFKGRRPRYGPETRLNADLYVGEYTAPRGVTLPMVALTGASQ